MSTSEILARKRVLLRDQKNGRGMVGEQERRGGSDGRDGWGWCCRYGATRGGMPASAGRPLAIPQRHPQFHSQQKRKDLLGHIMGCIGRGGTRDDADPYGDGTKTPLLLSRGFTSEKAGGVD